MNPAGTPVQRLDSTAARKCRPALQRHIGAVVRSVRRRFAVSDHDVVDDAESGAAAVEPMAVVVSRPSVVVDPGKLLRVAWSNLAVLDAISGDTLDEGARRRLAALWAHMLVEIGSALTPEVVDELHELIPSRGPGLPTTGELRVLQAQLVGWLHGVMRGEELSTWGAAVAGAHRLIEIAAEHRAEPHWSTPPRASPYL
jgi:hypothetical protein